MGLYNRQLESVFAIAKIKTVTDAERFAIEWESVCQDPRSLRLLSPYLVEIKKKLIDEYLDEE